MSRQLRRILSSSHESTLVGFNDRLLRNLNPNRVRNGRKDRTAGQIQLFGVRRLAALWSVAELSRPLLVECSSTTRRQTAAGQSGARPPHSKDLALTPMSEHLCGSSPSPRAPLPVVQYPLRC